jgi:hypothetical protein
MSLTICPNNAVSIGGVAPYYSTIQSAYNTADNGQAVMIQAMEFNENLNLDRDVVVTLKGGYECGFASNPGLTTITGSMTIGGNGTVTVERLIIK